MGREPVTAPDGSRWRVGRRWIPGRFWRSRGLLRRQGLGSVPGDWLDSWGSAGGPMGGDDLAGVAFGVVGFVLMVLAALVVVGLLAVLGVALELAVALALLGSALVGHVLLRRPWIVEVVNVDSPEQYVELPVKGWHASGRAIATLERRIATQGVPADPAALAAAD